MTASATRPCSTAASNSLSPSSSPAGSRPMNDTTSRKTRVPSTIHERGGACGLLQRRLGLLAQRALLGGEDASGPTPVRARRPVRPMVAPPRDTQEGPRSALPDARVDHQRDLGPCALGHRHRLGRTGRHGAPGRSPPRRRRNLRRARPRSAHDRRSRPLGPRRPASPRCARCPATDGRGTASPATTTGHCGPAVTTPRTPPAGAPAGSPCSAAARGEHERRARRTGRWRVDRMTLRRARRPRMVPGAGHAPPYVSGFRVATYGRLR